MPSPDDHRAHFPYGLNITTRWSDFDMMMHLNNVQYYRFFEAVVIDYLTRIGVDLQRDAIIPYAVESGCRFIKPIESTPEVYAALRVAHLGNSSVQYEIALFAGNNTAPAASGRLAQVFVHRHSQKPTPIPPPIRQGLEKIRQRHC